MQRHPMTVVDSNGEAVSPANRAPTCQDVRVSCPHNEPCRRARFFTKKCHGSSARGTEFRSEVTCSRSPSAGNGIQRRCEPVESNGNPTHANRDDHCGKPFTKCGNIHRSWMSVPQSTRPLLYGSCQNSENRRQNQLLRDGSYAHFGGIPKARISRGRGRPLGLLWERTLYQ